jgi:hypothetical protein
MTKRTLGLMAGVLSSAVGAWWWSRQRAAGARSRMASRERGTVIFDNTPTAAEANAL